MLKITIQHLPTYPRATDPAYNNARQITAVSATTITVNVGVSTDTSVHTFVSARKNAVRYFSQTTKGVSGFTYSNVTGYATVTTDASHLMVAGNKVVLKDLLLNCNSPHSRKQDISRSSTVNMVQV